MSIKQVILLRTTFPDGRGGTFTARKGKIASQTAHASMKVFLDRGWISEGVLTIPLTPDMESWVNAIFTKIVLGVSSEEDLLRAYALAQSAGLPCALITDSGATEFHGVPTHTSVAIGPAHSDAINLITGPAGAVSCKLL